MKCQYELSSYVELVFETPPEFSHWFGYYNVIPTDSQSKRILSHRISFDGRNITKEDAVEIGWFDISNGSWQYLGISKAFNWQQGTMLQWLGPDFSNRVIYNDVEDGRFIARIVDDNGKFIRTIPWPIYGVTPDGKKSITLQFERSYWCRAYSYETIQNPKWDGQIIDEDGIFSVDIISGKVNRIIDIKRIIEYDNDSTFNLEKHWIEHIMLNPSGSRFIFYHRFSEPNEDFKTRIFTADINGNNLYLVHGWREIEFTHTGWRNNHEFVIFKYVRARAGKVFTAITSEKTLGIIGQVIKKVYHKYITQLISRRAVNRLVSNNRYELHRDCEKKSINTFNNGLLSTDGHPSFTSDGCYMLTDTYADEKGYRHLLLFNIKQNKLIQLGRFFSPFNASSYRCDLHPRFSRDEKMIIIDSAHSEKRQIMVLRLNWEKIIRYSNK